MRKGWLKRLATIAMVGVGSLLGLGGVGYLYALGFELDTVVRASPDSKPADLELLRERVGERRGKILAVVTSTDRLGSTGKYTGFELTELSRAYYVFVANGYEVDIASPLGGNTPMELDDGMVAADYAFLNDPEAMRKVQHSLPVADIDPSAYAAVYFVGGKGTMFDFPENADIQRIVRSVYESGGIVGAICHGPAALLNVELEGGHRLIAGKRMTGFTNAEELFLMRNAREVFPYLLQDQMVDRDAQFVEGALYLDNTVVDGRIVTGQNPWSTWSTAEAMIVGLGHEPVRRVETSEEAAVRVLASYYEGGRNAAERTKAAAAELDRHIMLMHALVAAMQTRWRDAYNLQRLARP